MRLDDENDFVNISQDEKYQRFYDEADCDLNKYKELTRLFVQQAREKPRTAYQLAIEYKQTGNLVGTVCLRLESNHQASMGCGLSRLYQGQNLIQEAVVALANYGFEHLNVHRIYAETISENKPAIRLCKQVGMRKEAVFKEHRYFKGRWWDTVVLAMLQSEFVTKV